jgi:hypothetical protein
MAASNTQWRRWLPSLLGLAALVVLLGGITLGMTAATGVQRFLGWLLAAAGVCGNVVAVWLLWRWGRSGPGGPPPRH